MFMDTSINIEEKYAEIALKGEPVLDHSKRFVVISLENYEELSKASRNAEYLAKIDRGINQIESGSGQEHDLIEVTEYEEIME